MPPPAPGLQVQGPETLTLPIAEHSPFGFTQIRSPLLSPCHSPTGACAPCAAATCGSPAAASRSSDRNGPFMSEPFPAGVAPPYHGTPPGKGTPASRARLGILPVLWQEPVKTHAVWLGHAEAEQSRPSP